MADKLLFNEGNLEKEFCYYTDQEPKCMDNCFVKEEKGRNRTLAPACPYADVYPYTQNEGTCDSWEFERCKLRDRWGSAEERFAWARESCPYFKDMFGDFIDEYIDWAWRASEDK